MIDLGKRVGLIAEITNQKPGIGKTAMMKFIFLLQKVYKVPLGYSFDIYTYGPYSSEVMEDIDAARQDGVITIERVVYPNDYSGYKLTPADHMEGILKQESAFVASNQENIQKVIKDFGDKSAKELELITTIVYLYSNYVANGWSVNGVPVNVHEIKPHFPIDTIQNEYRHLEQLGLLSLATTPIHS